MYFITERNTARVQTLSSDLTLPTNLEPNPLYEQTEGLYDVIMHCNNLPSIRVMTDKLAFRNPTPWSTRQLHNNGPFFLPPRSQNFASFLIVNKEGQEDEYTDMSVLASQYITDV